MKDQSKTKQALIQELFSLKQRITKLEQSESSRKQADSALKESEERFRAIASNTPDYVFIQDRQLRYTFVVNSQLDLTEQDMIGKTDYDFLSKEEADELTQIKTRVLESGQPIHYETSLISKVGKAEFFNGAYIPKYDLTGKVDGLIGYFHNVTDRHHVEEALTRSEEKFRKAFYTSPDAVNINRLEDGMYVSINPGFTRITGYTEADIIGKTSIEINIWNSIEDRQRLIAGLRKDGEVINLEATFRMNNGEIRYGLMSASIIDLNGVSHILNITQDITERKQAEEALRDSEERYRELSIIDDLTQLYNSRHFYQQLKMEIDRADRYGQPLTLLLLDLDDFKQFNDAYGHIEGDKVLSRFGQVAKRCLRQTDSAYRYGGEEFTILMPMTTSKNSVVIAERIRAELREEILSPVSGGDVHMTVSIGLAQYKPQEDIKAFVHRVDQLMYQAKKNGKDRVCSES